MNNLLFVLFYMCVNYFCFVYMAPIGVMLSVFLTIFNLACIVKFTEN